MNQANAAQLAECMGVSKRTIQKRALREAWPFDEYPVRGGMQRVYPIDLLPEDVSIRVKRSIAAALGKTQTKNCTSDDPINHDVAQELGANEFARVKAKYALLQAALRYVRSLNRGKVEALDEFVQRFIDHKAPADDFVYREIPQVSRVSLLRWEKRYEQSGILGLLDSFSVKIRRFESAVNEQLHERFGELLKDSPNCTVSHAFSYFSGLYPVSFLPNARRWEKFRDNLKQQHNQIQEEENERPIWEMFVFPVALRFNNVENVAVVITELQTGRHYISLVETVTEQVCDAMLRQALLQWGKPEGVKVVSSLLPVSYSFQSALRAFGIRCWSNSRRYPMSKRSVDLVRYFLFCLCKSVQPEDVNSLMARVLFDLVQMTDVNHHQPVVITNSDDAKVLSQHINMPMLDLPYIADELHERIEAQRSTEEEVCSNPFSKDCFIEPKEETRRFHASPRLFDGLLAALPKDCGYVEVTVHGIEFEERCYSADWLVDYVGHVLHCRWDPIVTHQLFVFTGLTKRFLGLVQSQR